MTDPRGEEARTRKAWLFILRAVAERGERDADGTLFVPESPVARTAKGTFKRKDDFDHHVDELVERGYVVREKVDTGGKPGRPPVLLKVNPEVLPPRLGIASQQSQELDSGDCWDAFPVLG